MMFGQDGEQYAERRSCHSCGKPGHIARNCADKEDDDKKPAAKKQMHTMVGALELNTGEDGVVSEGKLADVDGDDDAMYFSTKAPHPL